MGDESRCGTDIPQELVTEILSRLPVKSLIRFTCVCKSWLGLIRNDNHFAIKQYVTRTTSSSVVLDHRDYIFVDEGYHINVFGALEEHNRPPPNLYSLTEAKTFRHSRKFECVVPADFSRRVDKRLGVSNSCHGIICFLIYEGSAISAILLCNPSIQEAVLLLPPCSETSRIALGYDPIHNDYKVVAISCNTEPYPGDVLCTVNLYSVRRGHWRNLRDKAPLFNLCLLDRRVALNANGRKCNWLIYKFRTLRTLSLLSIDMVDEVLNELPLPQCLQPKTHEYQLLSSSKWLACLSCLPRTWYHESGFVDVWVLKESTDNNNNHCENLVWSKELTVKCPNNEPMRPLNIWINDKELLVLIQKVKKKVKKLDEVFHYDIDTQQLRHTGRFGKFGACSEGYVESMVSIKGLMAEHREFKHGEDDKLNDDQNDVNTKGVRRSREFIFREVNTKGVRWSYSFKLAYNKQR